ncbi:MAG: carboxypeptidase-like regulatory domain-containing protein, partial [Tannerella sp.]|nr:carboxypeptidase-like regulatory domain-containing protein [Tannerella sp.]
MKRKICVFAATVSCLALYACKSNDLSESEETPQVYNVSGVIATSDGGAALGASVMLVRISDGSDAGQSPVNVAGEYIITGVSAGSYKIVATLDGYETASIDELTVVNADVTAYEIVLQKITVPTCNIGGTVSLTDGRAAAGVSVQIRKADNNAGVGQKATTDASGAYLIGGIPAGTYHIIFTLEGYETGILTDVTVTNEDLTDRNITLQPVVISENAVNITYSDNEVTVVNLPSDGSVTVTKSGADVTIASSSSGDVEFYVSGSTSGGSLKIQNNAAAPNTLRLTLNSAVIVSASKLPPVQITKNEGVTIVELKGSSILSDHPSNEENAALISKSGSLE